MRGAVCLLSCLASFAGVDKDKMTILGGGSVNAGVILSRNEIAVEWNSK
jgi:hypothetical protein